MASAEAKRGGIRTGMPLAEAQALMESAIFIVHGADADLQELQRLAGVCHRYSPAVGTDLSEQWLTPAAHCLLLDISGCAHLFGGELGLARGLTADFAQQGYFVHSAVADTIGSAWAIARFGHQAGSKRGLKSLPVEALRIPSALAGQLREFDLHTIGSVMNLPGESLPSRFGTGLMERLDQMFGRREELLVAVSTPDHVSAEWITDEPICHPDAVRYVCEDLLTEVLDEIKSRGEGLLQVMLTVKSEAGELQSFDLRMTRPTDSEKHVRNLLNLKLETQPIPEWLIAIQMEASLTASLHVRQRSLFDEDVPEDGAERRLCDRLSARLGQGTVVRAELLPEAVPEQAVGYRSPGLQMSVYGQEQPGVIASARPLELFHEPVPLSLPKRAVLRQPVTLEWNQRKYRIVRFTEPERIAAGWWQETGTIRRDYLQAETQSGARLWLFRDKSGQWFLHGVFE